MSISTEDLQAMLSGTSQPVADVNTIDQILANMNATISESPMVTNIPEERAQAEARGQRVVYIQPSPSATIGSNTSTNNQSAGNPFATIQQQLDAITKETDLAKKQQLMVGLEASTGEFITQKAKEARILAQDQLGISTLREQLAKNEQLDRADPKWQKFQSDSKITAAIRQRLNQTEGQVDLHSQRILKEDGELARLVKTVDSSLALQRSLIQKEEAKNFNKEQDAAKKQESLDTLISTVPQEVRDSFVKMNPTLADNKAFGAYLMNATKGGKDRDNFDALMSGAITPSTYLQAGLSGNTIALQLAVAEQASRTGIPKDIVEKQIQSAYNFVHSPEKFVEASTQMGLMNAKQAKAYISKLATVTDKEGKQALAQDRLALVEPYMAALQKNAIDSDVLKWSVGVGETAIHQAPGAQEAIQKLQAAGQPVTVANFSKTFLSQPGLTDQEVAQRQALIGDAYARALSRATSGIYGKGIDVVGSTNALMVKNTMNKLNPLGNTAQNIGKVSGEVTNNLIDPLRAPGKLLVEGVKGTGKTLSDFYRGFIGE